MSASASSTTNATGNEANLSFDAEHIVLYVVLSCYSVVGISGNAIAFYIFFRRRNCCTSDIFILALAGTDFIVCLVTIPFTIVFELLHYRLYYDSLCKLYMFFNTSTIPYSSLIMAAIAFDRYFCICHPFLHIISVERARIIVLCLAVPSLCFGVITGMSYGLYNKEDFLLTNGSVLLGTNKTWMSIPNEEMELQFLDVNEKKDGIMALSEISFKNDSQTYELHIYRKFRLNSECFLNNVHFTDDFMTWYLRVYTSLYILCFIAVVVLYILIYRSIFRRRAKKAKRKKKNNYVSLAVTDTTAPQHNLAAAVEVETALTELNSNGTVVTKTTTSSAAKNGVKSNGSHNAKDTSATVCRIPKKRSSTIRDRNLYANIRTAMMLFVVTVVFIIAFTPSLLIANMLIPLQLIVFYIYFTYNVANPFIYAFMNQTFREDLKKFMKKCFR
ncbi:cholecystokinin receptor type A-like isoform X1 [Pomacea canaliculata]|uniref:cholecystokinin receptor type A-like isoform X1 n=1 Tax=Pomacea canaliculata TaxID=400727 RepID=UPI000D7328CC|nr:cholecystokinin receptor type A-like isoform X1 [Pomacea canaliculata]XP_025083475.1 cholecystokinin receptor type A-like isoform X1 [Pomacea canaliculata]XP_025083476.1 cholecystokinin receptor type A-like isoform X1 [Pomacea canaliculata]